MKRAPPDHHIPVGTHAGDSTSKNTVPGAFEVTRKLLPHVAPPRSLTNGTRKAAKALKAIAADCETTPFSAQ
jgi:hypothetical protein